jgi:sugar phosphate isomerase/epimerase
VIPHSAIRIPQFEAPIRLSLIANNGMSLEDHPQPALWVDLIGAMGLRTFEYFADHLEPVFFRSVIRDRSEFFRDTLAAIRGAGLRVFSAATAKTTYLLNMLSHPYADMRRAAKEWMVAFMELAAALDAPYVTGHYDNMSRPDYRSDPARAVGWVNEALRELSHTAAKLGLKGIFIEQMHRPQLQPNTIANLHATLATLSGGAAVPFYPHLDVGHSAHVRDDPRHTARDKDPYAWLAEPFGRNDLVLVHLQQTDDQGSRHWPFTPEFNGNGIIDGDRVLAAIRKSGVKHAVCSLEVFFGRGTDWEDIVPAMVESAQYWRAALGRNGFREIEPGEFEG